MFLRTKKEVMALLDTVLEMTHAMIKMDQTNAAVSDCLAALMSIGNLIEKENGCKRCTLHLGTAARDLESIRDAVGNEKKIKLKRLAGEIYQLKNAIQTEIIPKLNVVFFPYKASMWNSLATVYEAAAKDDDCVAKVVPVPFYEIDGKVKTPMYEGELLPKDVPIIHYSQYNLEAEKPDIIYVHNIYDQYNTITRLDERFFASNLRKYTDMLVYVPYCLSVTKIYDKGEIHSEFSSPSMKIVDKVIVLNHIVKQGLIRNGFPKEKILALGSPKIDYLVKGLNAEIAYPDNWEKLKGKTVYLLNTGCMFFGDWPFMKVSWITWTIMSILAASNKNAVIWRPHPLTLASMKRYMPCLLEGWYSRLESDLAHMLKGYDGTVIIDDSPDYLPAFKISDVMVSMDSSLLYEYAVTEKKIIYWLCYDLPKYNWHNDSLYLGADRDVGFLELAHRFCEGYDPHAERRKGLGKKLFTIDDGTCGEKIHVAIKDFVVQKS